jgi:hypothetical protein
VSDGLITTVGQVVPLHSSAAVAQLLLDWKNLARLVAWRVMMRRILRCHVCGHRDHR